MQTILIIPYYTTLNPPGTLRTTNPGAGYGFDISDGVYRIRLQGVFAAFADSQIDKLRMAVLKSDPADETLFMVEIL